jgi:glycosyltransferase involved in cell wall biosynthesis
MESKISRANFATWLKSSGLYPHKETGVLLVGCPVIAFNKGGALETVKNMETGIFFNAQTAHDINSAIENFSKVSYTLQQLTAQNGEDEAKKFSIEHFHNQIKKYL